MIKVLLLLLISFSSYSNQIPWEVELRNSNGQFCKGILLSKDWILTAAHCVVDKRKYSFFPKSNQGVYLVDDVFIHNEYVYNPLNLNENDIALLKVVNFNISKKSFYPAISKILLSEENFNFISTYTKNVTFKNSFSEITSFEESPNTIKIKSPDNSCFGNSGGGLYSVDKNKEVFLHGFMFEAELSHQNSINHCDSNQFKYFVDIRPYINWILDITKSY